MATYTNSELCTKFNITSYMLATVDRHVNGVTGEVYYTVKSERSSERYEVHFNFKHATFTCTCEAGKHGFVHCKHGAYCKHVRAAKAHALAHRQAENAQARHEATEAAKASRKAFDAKYHALEQERDEARKAGGFSLLK